jgi:hypothetical protein
MEERFRISSILQLFLFFIPMNIYVIGEELGSGIQWFFFRYQQTTMGSGLVLLNREIVYVAKGFLTGKSAISIYLWLVGVGLIVIATL